MRTLLAVVVAAGFTFGCSSSPKAAPEGRTLAPDLVQSRVADIQVQRGGTSLHLTNTTPAPLPAGTFWVNGRFSVAVEALGVGESRALDLRQFRDQFGERFRAGGFFASEAPEPVVLAQWEAQREDGSSELIGLIAIAERR